MLSVYVLRFMTLGSKINSKFTNTSGLLTEQVRYRNILPLGGSQVPISPIITYMKKLLDSDWLRKECKNV